jgi:hypothetical protein
MLKAGLYIIACSARNRVLRRIRRLREPRYLLGALAGLGYFYFAIFTRTRGRHIAETARRGGAAPTALALLGPSAPALAGMALLVLAAVSWTYPIGSRLLSFSQAEKQLLLLHPCRAANSLVIGCCAHSWPFC